MTAAASTKRTVRPRARTVLLVLLLAWLIGRGLGWLGNGGAATDPTASVVRAVDGAVAGESPPAPDQGIPPTPAAGPVAPSESDGAAGLPAAAPLDELARRPVLPPSGAPAIDSDRFASMLSLVAHATEQGRFGSALASLQHVRSLPLDAAQQAALLLPAADLQRALSGACSSLAQQLLQGRVLAAHQALATLFADDGPGLGECVQQALQLAGYAISIQRDRRRDAMPVPIPRPLPRGRAVRCRCDGALGEGRVVDSRSDAVTVRLPNARGVTFPTVAMVACEPIDATADEAVEMGFAALQRDEVLLARLWLAHAVRVGGGDAVRVTRLTTLLP